MPPNRIPAGGGPGGQSSPGDRVGVSREFDHLHTEGFLLKLDKERNMEVDPVERSWGPSRVWSKMACMSISNSAQDNERHLSEPGHLPSPSVPMSRRGLGALATLKTGLLGTGVYFSPLPVLIVVLRMHGAQV